MFKFNNFPELQIFHEKYLNHEFSTTKALIDVVDKKKKGAQERFAKGSKPKPDCSFFCDLPSFLNNSRF